VVNLNDTRMNIRFVNTKYLLTGTKEVLDSLKVKHFTPEQLKGRSETHIFFDEADHGTEKYKVLSKIRSGSVINFKGDRLYVERYESSTGGSPELIKFHVRHLN
jgi:hypothetical protein